MRILNVSSLYPPNVVGGAELGVKTMSHALRDMGHEIDILTLSHKDAKDISSEPVSENIHVHAVPLANLYWPFNGKQKDPSKISRLLWHSIDSNNMLMSHKVKKLLTKTLLLPCFLYLNKTTFQLCMFYTTFLFYVLVQPYLKMEKCAVIMKNVVLDANYSPYPK